MAPLQATSMSLVSGSGQSAIVETVLTDPIEVIVKDQDGKVFKGATVKFAVTAGSISAAIATAAIK